MGNIWRIWISARVRIYAPTVGRLKRAVGVNKMNDMGWTRYNAMLEAGEEKACLEHRKKFGLTGLGDEDDVDCVEKPCSKGCPFAPKIREGATLKIHPATRDRLKDAGKKGETYDQIINRLLDSVAVS